MAHDRPGLRIGGAEDDRAEPRVDHRPGTHRTRLQRHVETTVVEAPRADFGGRIAHRKDLGMCNGVTGQLTLIVTSRDHDAVANDHGANRHVAVVERAPGFLECPFHRGVVVGKLHDVSLAANAAFDADT